MRVWLKKITAIAEGKEVWEERGESMEHRKTNQNKQSVSVYILGCSQVFGCNQIIFVLFLQLDMSKNIKKFSNTMLSMWLFGSNWFLMFCSRNPVIEAVEIQLFFKRPKVWPLDSELAQPELMLYLHLCLSLLCPDTEKLWIVTDNSMCLLYCNIWKQLMCGI